MKALSHQLAHRLEREDAVILLRLRKAGAPIYAYMRLKAAGFAALRRAMASGDKLDLAQHGEVLLAGDGEPDEETRAYMEEEYGFRHQPA